MSVNQIFIYANGNLSFDKKYYINFNTLLKNNKACTKAFQIYYENKYTIDCMLFYCAFSGNMNICFKEFKGPILLYNSHGFCVEDLNFIKKRCNIAKGKLVSQYM